MPNFQIWLTTDIRVLGAATTMASEEEVENCIVQDLLSFRSTYIQLRWGGSWPLRWWGGSTPSSHPWESSRGPLWRRFDMILIFAAGVNGHQGAGSAVQKVNQTLCSGRGVGLHLGEPGLAHQRHCGSGTLRPGRQGKQLGCCAGQPEHLLWGQVDYIKYYCHHFSWVDVSKLMAFSHCWHV